MESIPLGDDGSERVSVAWTSLLFLSGLRCFLCGLAVK